MTTVYFVRHAEPNYSNHDDRTRELTQKGLRDRLLVSEYLKNKEIDAVLSSPYKRAYDTVSHFAESRSFDIETVEDFRERRVDSVWIEDFNSFCRKQWEDFSYKLEDGETLQEVQDRNINALMQILEKYEGQNVVIGSHGTALSTIVNYFDKNFGFEKYSVYRSLMPWIVRFRFDGKELLDIEMVNHFEQCRYISE